MSRSKQTSKTRGRKRAAVTALGVAGALSLAGSASASVASVGDTPTQNTARVILAEEEISDVSLATFYVFDKENAGAHHSSVQLAARGCGHGGCGCRGCAARAGCRGCAVHAGCRGCAVHRGCRGCAVGGCGGCGGGCGGGCCIWIGGVRIC